MSGGCNPAVAAARRWPPLAPGLRFFKPAVSIGLRARWGLTTSLLNLAGAASAEPRAARGERRTRKMASRFLAACARAGRGGARGAARLCSDLERVLLLTGKTKRRTRTLSPNLLLTRKAALPSKRGYFLRCPAPSHLALETFIIIIIKQVRQPRQSPWSPALFSPTVGLCWTIFPGFWVV